MSHEAHLRACRAACFKHANRLPDFRSSNGACEVEIGDNEMRAIGNMRFCFRDRYSNNDSTSFRYAQCAGFVLWIEDFATRMDAKYAKCEMLLDNSYANNEKPFMVGVSMFANDPSIINWSSCQWNNRRISPNRTMPS
jgi:hypothetical protein